VIHFFIKYIIFDIDFYIISDISSVSDDDEEIKNANTRDDQKSQRDAGLV
jgi:hypothetical protein